MIKHSKREALNAIMTTIGICLMNFPIISGINNSGPNAANVVKMVAVTGAVTSIVPFTAASFGLIPRSTYP